MFFVAMLCAAGAAAVGAQAGKPTDYKGLAITVTGIERAMNVSLKDCPPGANSVRGNTKPGEEFIVVNVAFKVTPAYKETMIKKPVLVDGAGKTFNTSVSIIDAGSVPEYTCSFPFRVPDGTKAGKLQIDTATLDVAALDKK
jgi:hypothetical protein